MVLNWILTGISAIQSEIFSSTFHRFTGNKSIKAFPSAFLSSFFGGVGEGKIKKNAKEKLVLSARERKDSENHSLLWKGIRIDRVYKNME